jgi:hypothetical protein
MSFPARNRPAGPPPTDARVYALAGYKQRHRSSGSDTALDECTNQLKLRVLQYAQLVFIRVDSWIDLSVAMPCYHSIAALAPGTNHTRHRHLIYAQ